MTGRYGVRWQQWSRAGRLVTRQRFFVSEAARARFAETIEALDNFHAFVAWSDPQEVQP